VAKRTRRDLGKGVRLVWHRSPDRVTWHDGIACQEVADAVRVPREVGFDEIGDAAHADEAVQAEASGALETLGFPAPGDVALMDLSYQVAQKSTGSPFVRETVRHLFNADDASSRSANQQFWLLAI
jgi:hypothetical protein